MKASEFMTRHSVGHSVNYTEQPDNETPLPGHPWFRVRFMLTARHDHRWVEMNYGGAANDTCATITDGIGEVFYRMADAARYGESYEELVSDYGPNLHLTREQWERGQKDLRERCRAWLPDDTMWEEFLSVELD